MYHIENDSTEVITRPAYHGGEGVMRTRGFFDGVSRLPIKFQMWELDPGASEGGHVHEEGQALEEIYYFLSGEGTMWVDGDEFPVTTTGSEPLKLVIIWGKPAA